jgi:hypothetical protein
MHYHDSEDLKRVGELKQLAPAEFPPSSSSIRRSAGTAEPSPESSVN